MQEKVWVDLDREVGPIENRKNGPFHQFIYDSIIMQKGLQSIAVKTLFQMTNGLHVYRKQPYAAIINKMLGMSEDPYRLDAIQIVLRCHMLFKLVQQDWIHRLKTNHPTLEITRDNEMNLKTGGECLVFDMIDELSKAFPQMQKDMVNKVLS